MKLELKHLAPYLPYELKGLANFLPNTYFIMKELKEGFVKGKTLEGNNVPLGCNIKDYKPILRPLSDLTKQNKIHGKVFVPLKIIQLDNNVEIDSDGIVTDGKDHYGLHWLAYESMLFLFKWHFDVFGLIENNLAIDINTLNK